jgi:sulfatase maturation enzyme AslB (radical SAM superfamily)
VSVDGPEAVHDAVRAKPGCFREITAGLKRLAELDSGTARRVSRGICFTISPWSVRGLGEMPAVARSLGVETIVIVPYCFVAGTAGATWAREVRELVGGEAFSWHGFHHESSGVDCAVFADQHRRYRETLDGLFEYPYLPLSSEQYRLWFSDPTAPVEPPPCSNVERLIDIQPTGEANFCVDLPDAALGNVTEATIAEIWNGERARRFRERRRQGLLGACHRCVARHMADVRN